MTLPTRAVTCTYIDPTTSYHATGSVTFTPSTTLEATVTDVTVPTTPVTAYLDGNGTITVNLVPTDVAEISPSGWTYSVVEKITGAPVRTYNIFVPSGASPLNLANVSPAVAQAYQQYLQLTGGTLTGMLTLQGGLTIPSGAALNKVWTSDANGLGSWVGSSGGPPNGAASGDLGGNYPGPTVVATHLAVPLPVAQGGTGAATAAAAAANLGALQVANNLSDLNNAVTARSNLKIIDPTFPLSTWGLLAATIDPRQAQANVTGVGGNIWQALCWIPAGVAITNLWCAVSVAGTWDGSSAPNNLEVSDINGNQLGATANDSTLWTVAGWRGGAVVGGPVAAQSTGRYVWVGFCTRGMSAGLGIQFCNSASNGYPAMQTTVSGASARTALFTTSSSAGFPASFTPSSYGSSTGYVPCMGVS